MVDLLADPIGGKLIALAPERAKRPDAPRARADAPDPEPCDFCPGREEATPPETARLPQGGGWRVRAFPNLYPAAPFHEIVVHSPGHESRFEDLDLLGRVDVLRMHRSRIRAGDHAAALVVWNRGRGAGASRSHEHSQVLGVDRVPPVLLREADRLGAECALCAVRDRSLQITASGGVALLAHPVPSWAGELLIVPHHEAGFGATSDVTLGGVADALGAAAMLQAGTPFNVALHTAPRGAGDFHWHLHLMPRAAVWGGVEVGFELLVVAADPYETAAAARRALQA